MIKVFENIESAYSGNCCICKCSIEDSLTEQFGWKGYYYSSLITIDLPHDFHMVFNRYNGDIVECSVVDSEQTYICSSITPKLGVVNRTASLYNGEYVVTHTIHCTKCSMYSRTLQIFINFDDRKVSKAVLNSEFVCFETEKDVYEIKNIYTVEKTEYTHITSGVKEKTIFLPLISDSMNCPSDVLNRIKKVLVFY